MGVTVETSLITGDGMRNLFKRNLLRIFLELRVAKDLFSFC